MSFSLRCGSMMVHLQKKHSWGLYVPSLYSETAVVQRASKTCHRFGIQLQIDSRMDVAGSQMRRIPPGPFGLESACPRSPCRLPFSARPVVAARSSTAGKWGFNAGAKYGRSSPSCSKAKVRPYSILGWKHGSLGRFPFFFRMDVIPPSKGLQIVCGAMVLCLRWECRSAHKKRTLVCPKARIS